MPARPSRRSVSASAGALTAAGLGLVAYAAQPDATDAGPAGPATGFAVVELFTSEGCSSCPPADRLLAEVQQSTQSKGLPVYALSFHVDYWDRLGWADPYGAPEFSDRQRGYAAAAGERSVYTPQMIVNGRGGFVGSDGKRASAAVSAALATPGQATLTVETSPGPDGGIAYAYRASGDTGGASLNVALVQPAGSQQVSRGENAGRRLDHVNIVRAFQTLQDAPDGGTGSIARPAGAAGPFTLVAYLQDPTTMRVLAAASAPAP